MVDGSADERFALCSTREAGGIVQYDVCSRVVTERAEPEARAIARMMGGSAIDGQEVCSIIRACIRIVAVYSREMTERVRLYVACLWLVGAA